MSRAQVLSSLKKLLEPHPRVRILRDGDPDPDGRCVIYWMQRSQRGRDNPALNLAIELGNELKQPVLTVFGLTADYPGAQRRHYRFLVEGLVDVEADLAKRGVLMVVRLGPPNQVIRSIAAKVRPSIVIGDENPVHVGQHWRSDAAKHLKVPFRTVDADVVVPSSFFPREEYAARTIRPKIHRIREEWLVEPGNPRAHVAWSLEQPTHDEPVDPDALMKKLKVGGVSEVPGYLGGSAEAKRRLARFVKERLSDYDELRNEPVARVNSELSAHLHFGQIGPITIARAVLESDAPRASVDAFLEELIVRRELAINFVARNPDYDRLTGCPDWALKTLAAHANDPRPAQYKARQLEDGETHDPLWNAAQKEMLLTGRMHNYLRMYWAKKILEWSPDAESAFDVAVDLNDRYEMDGRDPNGYAGIAWAIGGKHDRPWPERPIFGTVRFMSLQSTGKKFDSAGYIDRIAALERDGLDDA